MWRLVRERAPPSNSKLWWADLIEKRRRIRASQIRVILDSLYSSIQSPNPNSDAARLGPDALWPCDAGSLIGSPSSIQEDFFFVLSELSRNSSMAVDSHSPTPKGILCNAGAGAAAGKASFSLSRTFPYVTEELRRAGPDVNWTKN